MKWEEEEYKILATFFISFPIPVSGNIFSYFLGMGSFIYDVTLSEMSDLTDIQDLDKLKFVMVVRL